MCFLDLDIYSKSFLEVGCILHQPLFFFSPLNHGKMAILEVSLSCKVNELQLGRE